MDVKVEHNKGIPFLTSDAYRIHRHLFFTRHYTADYYRGVFRYTGHAKSIR